MGQHVAIGQASHEHLAIVISRPLARPGGHGVFFFFFSEVAGITCLKVFYTKIVSLILSGAIASVAF